MAKHNPRCAIFHDPPSMRDASACNCGAIPTLNNLQEKCDKLQTRVDELEETIRGELCKDDTCAKCAEFRKVLSI